MATIIKIIAAVSRTRYDIRTAVVFREKQIWLCLLASGIDKGTTRSGDSRECWVLPGGGGGGMAKTSEHLSGEDKVSGRTAFSLGKACVEKRGTGTRGKREDEKRGGY